MGVHSGGKVPLDIAGRYLLLLARSITGHHVHHERKLPLIKENFKKEERVTIGFL